MDAGTRKLSQDELGVSRDGMPTYLEMESGTAALAVSREGKRWSIFYLDKPVRLQKGFSLPSSRGKPARSRAGTSRRRRTKQYLLEAASLPLYTKPLEVRAIYTLFYQEKNAVSL